MTFPPELDCSIYRSLNPDLASFDDSQLIDHWDTYGFTEGRTASVIHDRDSLFRLLEPCQSILEIGVFDKPSLEFLRAQGRTVHYADWLDKEELIRRATGIPGRNPADVPDIQYVLSKGYDQIKERYNAIVSNHCVEHQPCLIRHLSDVHSKLAPGGWYIFSVPDKRKCFDHFIPESTFVDAVEAYYSQRKSPSLKSVLEHRCLTRHDYQVAADPYITIEPTLRQCLDEAHSEFAKSEYVDVHCWQFTPHGFKKLYAQLQILGLVPLCRELCVYCAGIEFYVAIAF
jgi:SAM-dependent methyltransferase